jgi:hypothetical protein
MLAPFWLVGYLDQEDDDAEPTLAVLPEKYDSLDKAIEAAARCAAGDEPEAKGHWFVSEFSGVVKAQVSAIEFKPAILDPTVWPTAPGGEKA